MAYPGYFSTFIRQTRRSWQCTAAEAGIPPAETGTPGMAYPGYLLNVHNAPYNCKQDTRLRSSSIPHQSLMNMPAQQHNKHNKHNVPET
jgi:hypothetical protein